MGEPTVWAGIAAVIGAILGWLFKMLQEKNKFSNQTSQQQGDRAFAVYQEVVKQLTEQVTVLSLRLDKVVQNEMECRAISAAQAVKIEVLEKEVESLKKELQFQQKE